MEPVYVGIWSIVPPIISILFALIFKEIISSLVVGILVGTFIYSIFAHIGIVNSIGFVFSLLSENMSGGVSVIIFSSLLGAISEIMSSSGSSSGCANWARKKIKSPVSSQLLSLLLSFVCSIDDVFMSLTVGNIMRPICDRSGVCRAKLAYLLDMTSSQLCLLMPFSSWTAAIISCIFMDNSMEVFIKSIPLNFYAIFSVLSAISFSFCKNNLGIMNKFQRSSSDGKDISSLEKENNERKNENGKDSKVLDLILPILILILVTIFMIFETSGFFSENIRDFSTLLRRANMDLSLTFGSFIAILFCLIRFVPRKMSFEKFMSSVTEGFKSMTSTSAMLILAWSISSICRDNLMINEYIKNLIVSSNISSKFIPFISFLLSSFLSFSIGSSWGTFMLLIPIVSSVFSGIDQPILILSVSSILSGSVAGVNCSPISNSGMIASIGAGCKHMDHISSQIPYALFTSFVSGVSFLIYPFTNLLISYLVSISIIIVFTYILNKKTISTSKKHILPKNK